MNLLQAYQLLNMLTENTEASDYKEKNINYILEHKARVKEFADWLLKNLPELFENINLENFNSLIEAHDDSKFSEEEFEPYAQKWFGDGKKTPEYEAAWVHHYSTNKHHPEFWLGEDMPYIYILEMLCDWGSFSMKSGDLNELSDFYYNKARDDKEKNLSEATKEIIEDILSKINYIINKEA
jgi:hypothetical protein